MEDLDTQETPALTEGPLFVEAHATAEDTNHSQLRAVIEAIVYITDEPLTALQIANSLNQPQDLINKLLDELSAAYASPEHGLTIREVAGGYKMATKAEYHDHVRAFVKNLRPPMKLSLPALETLAVVAYKQPITAPEIMEIRGVQGAGVLKTLLDRKLIAPGGRKNVIGKPILYKTTREFLIQFGLKDVSELPTLKEFEELGRLALSDDESDLAESASAPTDELETAPASEDVEQHPPVEEPEPQPEPISDPDPADQPPDDPGHAPVKN